MFKRIFKTKMKTFHENNFRKKFYPYFSFVSHTYNIFHLIWEIYNNFKTEVIASVFFNLKCQKNENEALLESIFKIHYLF